MPLTRVSDEDLISLSRERDERAFEELVARYRPDLLRVCRRMVGSTDDAEDVLQDVFAAAYVAILADGRPIDCAPWLHRIARNRCLNKLRRNRSVEPLTIEGENGNGLYTCDGGASTADKAHLKAELEMVVDDISRLPQSQRDALVRYAVGGYSYEQIAQQMGLSLASIRSLLMRARTALADAAAGREVPCSEARHELEEHRGVKGRLSAAVRQHVKTCELCAQHGKTLRRSRRSVLAILPFGPGTAASFGSASGTGAGLGSAAGVGVGALATKAVAGLAVLALAGAGAVVIDHSTTTSKHKPPTSSSPVSTPGVAAAAINRHPSLTPLTRHTTGSSHPQVATPPPHGRVFVKKPPASSLVGSTQGNQPSSSASPVHKRVISNVSQPQVTRRVRPLPGSGGGNTIRTRPAPQATQPPASTTPSSSSGTTTTTQTSSSTTTAPAAGS
jgi:RNA polymerase sigma factor (sigma-70 family)